MRAKKDNEENKKLEISIISGQFDKVNQILIEKISKDLYKAYQHFSEALYEKETKKIIEAYKSEFQKIGKKIPEHILNCSSTAFIKKLVSK